MIEERGRTRAESLTLVHKSAVLGLHRNGSLIKWCRGHMTGDLLNLVGSRWTMGLEKVPDELIHRLLRQLPGSKRRLSARSYRGASLPPAYGTKAEQPQQR